MLLTQHDKNLLTAEKIVRHLESIVIDCSEINLFTTNSVENNLIHIKKTLPLVIYIKTETIDGEYIMLDFGTNDELFSENKTIKTTRGDINIDIFKHELMTEFPEITDLDFYTKLLKVNLSTIDLDLKDTQIKVETIKLEKELNKHNDSSKRMKI